eukprot:CAMPEP_0177703822 /NCGR_PEP_ID=MMETSP0484_2-20121128/7875_1 /TAXON_ID=354590 /ORGANISM="Rhodomonas lens, Strain RHODO" /LENGTH=619 /DNA_ID=CAMNT_0019215199 /DNA_START=233 /DNA_END=2089 /DNA_ORIENTATION=-
MAAKEDPVQKAYAILTDSSQLCKMIRGETEACAFNSSCSECFTAVAMQYLCCPDPALSNPAKVLLPLVLSEFGDAQNGSEAYATSPEGQDPNPSLLHMMQEKEKEVAHLQAQLEAEEQKVAAQLAQQKLQEKENQIAQLNARLQEKEQNMSAQLKSRLQEQEQTIAQLNARLQEKEQNMSAQMKSRLQEQEQTIAQLNARVKETEQNMSSQMKTRLQEQEQTITQLNARMKETEQNLSSQMKTRLQEQEQAIATQVKARLQEQERRLVEREAECKALESKSVALAQALEAKSLALAKLMQEKPIHQLEQAERKPPSSAAQLVQSGVQVIAAAELDLDFAGGSKTLLGTGVFSEVYATTRRVAVKAFRGRFSQQRFREFKQEAEVLQSVQAVAGVIKLHGICIDSLPNLYLVMEPALGGSLETMLAGVRGQGLPLETACVLARNIAAIMRDVHGKGVVHRDLKPSNCLLTDYDRHAIKLVDFGLARTLSGETLADADEDGAGTPMFQAPEALEGAGVGVKADVYAFGITLWELLSGQTPFQELSLSDMRLAVVAGARPPIQPAWPEELAELLRGCWAPDPAARPHFAQVVQKLERLLAQLSPHSTTLHLPHAAPPRPPTD